VQQCNIVYDKERNKLMIKLRVHSRIDYTAEGHQFIEQTLDKIQPIIQKLIEVEYNTADPENKESSIF
jgi:hypothetical protein